MDIEKEIQRSVARATRQRSEEEWLVAVPELESEALTILRVTEELDDVEVESLCRAESSAEDMEADELESLHVEADRVVDRLAGKSRVSEVGEP